jgi:hypothetical protein
MKYKMMYTASASGFSLMGDLCSSVRDKAAQQVRSSPDSTFGEGDEGIIAFQINSLVS